MKLQVLQHVPFEGPAAIAEWARLRGHSLAATRLFASDPLPDLREFDRLIVIGGSMGVHDEGKHGWLAGEKALIREAIDAGRSVIGVCLGAQLIASVLGAHVYPADQKEIGWFAVWLTEEGRQNPVSGFLPERFTAFHWHGDTFDLPAGAVHLMRSDACEHQGFLYGDRVLGLQFHLEAMPASVRQITAACARELDEAAGARYVQSAERIIAPNAQEYRLSNNAIQGLLDRVPQ